MIKEFEEQLIKLKFHHQNMQPEWVHVYSRDHRVVACMEDNSYVEVTLAQTQEIIAKLESLYQAKYGKADVLVIIFTTQLYRVAAISQATPYCWVVDEVHEHFHLYENQPADMFGLRRVLEQLEPSPGNPQDYGEYQDGMTVRGKEPFFQAPKKVWATYTIVLANILVFAILSLLGDTTDTLFMINHGAMYPNFVIYNNEWYLLFTCMFLHFGIMHLANNMIILFCLGQQLERAVGHFRFLVIYLLSGMCGSALSLYLMQQSGQFATVAGASGAIFGVMGGLLIVILLHKGRYKTFSWQRMLIMLGLCLYFGFAATGVDNAGHVGGLLGGMVCSFLLYGIPYLIQLIKRKK